MNNAISVAACLVFALAVSHGSWAQRSVAVSTVLPGNAGIEKLQIKGLSKVTTEQGDVYFLSDNKRFVFRGTMHDLWSGDDISIEPVSQRVDFERNGVSIENISMKVGSGAEVITVFVAPECDACADLVTILLDDENREKYTVNVVLLDVTERGKKANRIVWCAKDRPEALVAVYVDGVVPHTAAKEGEDCDQLGLLVAKEAAKLFGIGQLPMVVDSSGNGKAGMPGWLINN